MAARKPLNAVFDPLAVSQLWLVTGRKGKSKMRYVLLIAAAMFAMPAQAETNPCKDHTKAACKDDKRCHWKDDEHVCKKK
jgi:hypothetical protein